MLISRKCVAFESDVFYSESGQIVGCHLSYGLIVAAYYGEIEDFFLSLVEEYRNPELLCPDHVYSVPLPENGINPKVLHHIDDIGHIVHFVVHFLGHLIEAPPALGVAKPGDARYKLPGRLSGEIIEKQYVYHIISD